MTKFAATNFGCQNLKLLLFMKFESHWTKSISIQFDLQKRAYFIQPKSTVQLFPIFIEPSYFEWL